MSGRLDGALSSSSGMIVETLNDSIRHGLIGTIEQFHMGDVFDKTTLK